MATTYSVADCAVLLQVSEGVVRKAIANGQLVKNATIEQLRAYKAAKPVAGKRTSTKDSTNLIAKVPTAKAAAFRKYCADNGIAVTTQWEQQKAGREERTAKRIAKLQAVKL